LFQKPPKKLIISKQSGGFMGTKQLLGARIKELRKMKGLTQDKLSQIIDIEQKHLSRIEVGKNYPSIGTLEKFALALNVDIKDFFDFKEQNPKNEIKEKIRFLIEETDAEKLRIIFNVVKAIIKNS
jgi:transcriptional regulator with XRE-family HTH domain